MTFTNVYSSSDLLWLQEGMRGRVKGTGSSVQDGRRESRWDPWRSGMSPLKEEWTCLVWSLKEELRGGNYHGGGTSASGLEHVEHHPSCPATARAAL